MIQTDSPEPAPVPPPPDPTATEPGPEPRTPQLPLGPLAEAWATIASSAQGDQIRGRANEAMGNTKFAIGYAVGSRELALEGLAQKALGAMQRYVGEAKMDAEGEAPNARDDAPP